LQLSSRRGLSRFVGRDREIEEMKRALERTIGGRGQVVAAMGAAGLGKSRLFYEFKMIAGGGCLTLEVFSVSHGKASAYLPVHRPAQELFRDHLQRMPNASGAKKSHRQSAGAGSHCGRHADLSVLAVGRERCGRSVGPSREC
jgi:predicted ATPase